MLRHKQVLASEINVLKQLAADTESTGILQNLIDVLEIGLEQTPY